MRVLKAYEKHFFNSQIQSLNTDFIVPMEMKLKEERKSTVVSFVHLSLSHMSSLGLFAEGSQDIQN